MIAGQRQRTDGSWTFCTVEHDAKWYFTVGQAVHDSRGTAGVVVKVNNVTVDVQMTNGRIAKRVPMPALTKDGAM